MNNFCSNCGNSNNNGAFCTNCGAPINQVMVQSQTNTNTGRLIVERKGKVMGFAIKVHVKINGVSYELGAGQNITLDLVPGTYVISYDVWCRREKSLTINVMAGNNYLVDLVYDPLWGGFKVGKNSKLQ